MSPNAALQLNLTRTEDRATQRCDPSAAPGAKTGVGTAVHHPVPLPCPALRDWHQSDKPSRHDAATVLTGGPSLLANAGPVKFQFPVNQDIATQPRLGRPRESFAWWDEFRK